MIGEGDGRHALIGDVRHQVAYAQGTMQQAVVAMAVKMNEGRR